MKEITTWPGWENMELLGEGSFGKVYKIRREEFGVVNEAALKVITIPGSQADLAAAREEGMDDASVTNYFKSFVEDLAAEFALMSSLKGNSNIVSYEDHMVIPREGEVGWDILIRMELLTPLQAAAARKALTERDAAALGIDMCRALSLCRNRGIIHRDIKPENIFISKDGCYKLGDFGVARVAEKTVSAMSRKGTYSYMAPEVYKGEKYGFAADIYSLGIVLYRYLNNNRLPFLPPYPAPIQYSDRESALTRRIGGEELPPPENGSAALKEAVLKACAYRAEDRYDSAESFMEDLKSALHAMNENPKTQEDIAASEPERLTQEKLEEDAFDKTMSAVVLGQAKGGQAEEIPSGNSRKGEEHSKDSQKDDNLPKDSRKDDMQPKENRQGQKNLRNTEDMQKKHPQKEREKDTKMKIVPIAAGVGGLVLALVVLVIVLGKGDENTRESMTDDTRKEQSVAQTSSDAQDTDAEGSGDQGTDGEDSDALELAAPSTPDLSGLGSVNAEIVTPDLSGAGSDGQSDAGTEDDQSTAGTEEGQSAGGTEQARQDVLAMLDTPTDAAQLADHKTAAEKFDGRLVGAWERFQVEQLGENPVVDANYHFTDILIFETGKFYTGSQTDWMGLMEKKIALPIMTVNGGSMDIFEAGKEIYDEGTQRDDDIYTLLPSINDLSVTYKVTDYEPEENDSQAYVKDSLDLLTIHIQGNYQDGPMTVKTVDTLYHYKKDYYSLGNWFYPSLEGRWTDNNGYIWAFEIARESAETFIAKGFEIVFAMKDASGQIHEGKQIYISSDSNGDLSLSIKFQDEIAVPEYTVKSYDGLTLELEAGEGNRLTLTRS